MAPEEFEACPEWATHRQALCAECQGPR